MPLIYLLHSELQLKCHNSISVLMENTTLYDAATVDKIVETLRSDFQRMIDDSQAEIHERLGKIEQLLNQLVYPNTTPSISLINSTLSHSTQQLETRRSTTRRKSRSFSKSTFTSELIPEFDNIKAVSAKELRKKDSRLEESGLITLHFLYKYKKVAILPFTPGTFLIFFFITILYVSNLIFLIQDITIKQVKEALNKELEKSQAYCIDKLQLSSKRLTEDVNHLDSFF